jgi:methylmalonyl-CoA mutase N-terminal domain/subunit
MSAPDYSALAARQVELVRAVRRRRPERAWREALDALESAARGTDALMPPILAAVRARATVGEISDTLRGVWGVFRPHA